MPTDANPAVIAADLADARSATAPQPRRPSRWLLIDHNPDYIRALACPSVTVTPAAMAADPAAVHALVRALSTANPSIEVHLPPPTFDSAPTQADIDQTRRELERDNDEVHARRLLRRIKAIATDAAEAWAVWLENVPQSRRTRAAQEAIRRRIRTGMTQADALRSVAADYAAGRLS
ncbi:hypothetical protein [Blastococcus sp. CT_GayMR16]|uniref:hypothetical protein n=1 Tax=Blastococcus sp. CT_GayMR16 TaxID=2559607 RepID=UPI001073D830|nr:hypothetical protein [Blastococcus sp. CT_GayMR16]TFV83133.1 hypothetical protein E4P38_20985 [Blastococcus sp. CT_GayMR16]